MKSTKKNNMVKRLIASLMVGTMMFSAGSALTLTASAATVSSYSVPSEVTDGFFSGASTLVSVISKTHPVAGIISSGLLGAFKTFYGNATKTPQPTTADIVNLINELSQKIDKHYNEQNQQLKAITDIQNLQQFSDNLSALKAYNIKAMNQIALFDENDVCEQDYKNITKVTVDNESVTNNFIMISNLVKNGPEATKGLPSFEQYLALSKACKENNHDSETIKKDCKVFNNMTLEQYALNYVCIMTGYMAQYNLAEYQYNNGTIDLKTKNSLQKSIKGSMELYTETCKGVVEKYQEITEKLKTLTVAEVEANGQKTSLYSLADAWAKVSNGGGTMKLLKDWKTDDFKADIDYYEASDCFKDGALFVKDKNVTVDLNGFSIIHKNNKKYDFREENATLTIKSSNGKVSSFNGVLCNGGNVKIDNVTVRESADAAIRANNLKLDISNSILKNNKNSAIVPEKNATTTVTNCEFTNNYQSAIYNKDSKVTVNNSTFTGNVSDSSNGSDKNGGAIYTHSTLNVNGCSFNNNKARKGGAIYSDDSFNVTNSSFAGNTASNSGGAIFFDYRGSGNCRQLKVSDSTFSANRASADGGALYVDSMNYLDLNNVDITNNYAGKNGGGLYAQKGSGSSCDPTISGKITIINNTNASGKSNAFLGENSTSKCIFKITDNINPNSRIGITSPTNDRCLDVVKIWKKSAYNNTANVFSYDTSKYKINRYNPWYSELYWVEIKK